MRFISLIFAAVLLAGCSGDYRENPTHVCLEREVVSGKCVKGEYRCFTPLVLVPFRGGVICAAGAPQ
jgi:hypothetical protein